MESFTTSIERVDHCVPSEPWENDYFYVVTVVRLSDGATVVRIFSWRWSARRFARSMKRITKEFIEMGDLSLVHL